jgi:hypothetical protein
VIEVQTQPIETVTPITFREAVRLGRLMAPERTDFGWGSGRKACVLRAAYLGGGGDEFEDGSPGAYDWLCERFGIPVEMVKCPADRGHAATNLGIAFHLYDEHDWSDDAVCDWLELL